MVVEVVAEGHDNEKELHRHASIPCDSNNVESVLRIRNCLTLANINFSAQEACEDDSLHGDQEDLNADKMAVEEWVILA